MKDEDIKARCYEIWPKHWRDLAPSSNSRALFVKEMIKLSPDEDELKRIEGSILAQTRFWRKKSKIEKVFGIPRLSQWIKDCRFDDAFIDESYVDLQDKIKKNVCNVEGCTFDVLGDRFKTCDNHIPDPKKAEKYEALGEYKKKPDETTGEWRERCRQYGKKNLYGLVKGLYGTI